MEHINNIHYNKCIETKNLDAFFFLLGTFIDNTHGSVALPQ